jgi:sugar phosphate isomerase/epimerase
MHPFDLLSTETMNSPLRWILSAAFSLALTSTAAEVGTSKSFKGPLGLQLYSLRADFARDEILGLDETKDFGFKLCEIAPPYKMGPEKFRAEMKKRDLHPIGAHFPYARYKTDPEGVVQEAKAYGLAYAGCAAVDHKGDFDLEQAKEAVKVLNHAGEVLKKSGIQFYYHCHGFEFVPNGDETLMDYLIQNTDPKNVVFEMDVMWVVHPGKDPVKFLNKYPGRWQLMHMKDMRKGTEIGFGGTALTNDVPIGTGVVDWPAVLKAAKKCGVKYYFIEDESPTVKDQIPVSLKYLSEVKF